MRESYKTLLALPTEISFDVVWEADEKVDQKIVDAFVNNLKARPGWYKNSSNPRPGNDTQIYVLQTMNPFKVRDDGTGRLERFWICDSCKRPVPYEGLQLGHKVNWKDELKKAGVKLNSEAKAAYNNLLNIRVECSTCNSSHDFEELDFD